MKTKCPACGFKHEGETTLDDMFLCIAWAYLYSLNKGYPTKEQFEAMQRKGYLPTQGGREERIWEINYGHYGWAVDYDWPKIAANILATNTVTVQ
jgi:hypothetical protein